ncbi:MAG: polysaccharide biosynthesis C-terminal domain-containing protein [Chloroflexi bacterium]|nr:polysaccharide biosynthesis C-terminal domain-containing protein [Chloroflexota bacterium]
MAIDPSENPEAQLGADVQTPVSDPASIAQRMLNGTMANNVGQFITLVIGFFLTPFVLQRLGPASYGLWVLIGSIVAYGTVLDFGIWGTVVKYVAEYKARGELARAHTLVATALRCYVVLGLIAAGLSLIIAPFVPYLFNVAPTDSDTAVWLVVLSGVGLGVSIPSVTATAVLRGLQRFDLVNLLIAIGTVLTGAGTVTVLLLGWGVLGIAAVVIPTTVLMQVPSIWLVNRIAPDLHFGWRGARLSEVRTIVAFSSSLFVMQLAGRLQTKTDEIVIAAFLPVSAVTPYALARRLSEMVSLICEQSTKVMVPLASQLDADRQWSRLRTLYLTSSRLTLALASLGGITLIMLAGSVLTVWVGPAYADSAYLVAILAAASIIMVSLLPAGSILQGSARHRPLAVTGAISAVANLVLSVILVRMLGVAGVALGTLIPTVVVNFAIVLPYVARAIGVSIGTMVGDIWVPALLPAIPLAAVLYGFRSVVGLESPPVVILAAAAGAIAYVTTYLFVGAREEERQIYRTLISLSLTRLGRQAANGESRRRRGPAPSGNDS